MLATYIQVSSPRCLGNTMTSALAAFGASINEFEGGLPLPEEAAPMEINRPGLRKASTSSLLSTSPPFGRNYSHSVAAYEPAARPGLERRKTANLTGFSYADTHATPPSLKGGPAWDTTDRGSIWDEVLRSQEHMKKNPPAGEVIMPHVPKELDPTQAAVQTTIGSPKYTFSPPPMSNKRDGMPVFEQGGADLHKRSWPAEKKGGSKWDKTPAGSIWDEIIKSQQYMGKK